MDLWSIEDDEDSLKDSKCRYYETLEFSNVFKENYCFAAILLNIKVYQENGTIFWTFY